MSDALTTLRVESATLGPFATNCYVVWADAPAAEGAKRPAWIIDAGMGPLPLLRAVRAHNLLVEKLILTHAHIDHIAGVREVLDTLSTSQARPRLLIHAAEERWLTDPVLNLSTELGLPTTTPPADDLLQHSNTLRLGALDFTVLHTPGHSPGGISLHCAQAGVVFAGDALFAGSIGRTDFPGCSFEDLERSIRARLYTLPDRTKVYCGHGLATTIGAEKTGNPYVRA
jgi:hydroxyacylglutathione hydrolase